MAIVITPIYTQTVGSGGVASITFNNIPQNYTDLKFMISARTTLNNIYDSFAITLNGDTGSNYSQTELYGTGSSAASGRLGVNWWGYMNSASTTSTTFGVIDYYIPNYTASNFKQVIIDSVVENNNTSALVDMQAGLWRSTSAIASINFKSINDATILQHSTFSLYGIIRSGA